MQNIDTIKLTKVKCDIVPFVEKLVFKMSLNCKVNIVSVSDKEELHIDRTLFKQVMQTVIKSAENAIIKNNKGRIDILIDRIGKSLLICVENTNHPNPNTKFKSRIKMPCVNGTREEIGLNDCKRILKAHGGMIWFASRSGKETNVKIKIPV